MFLNGTLHILTFYLVIGVLLAISRYSNRWRRLKSRLESKVNKESLSKIFIAFSAAFIPISILVYCFHKYYSEISFQLFATVAWVFLPLAVTYSGISSFLKQRDKVLLGEVLVLMFAFGGIGGAASNIHDVVFCTERTDFYSKTKMGYELNFWKKVFHPPSYDYRILGFYMGIQVIIFFILAYLAFSAFEGLGKTFKLLVTTGTLTLALGLTLIDFPRAVSPPQLHALVVMVLLLASVLIFYKSGRRLARDYERER